MSSFRPFDFFTVSAIIFFAFALPASATDFDAGQQFSNAQNPNGVWSYRGVTTGTSNLTGGYLLDEHGEIGDSGIIAWTHEWGDGVLSIGNDDGRYETVGMHPGGGEDALLAFESEASLFGVIADVTINVYDGSNSTESNGQILSVWKNDSLLEGPIHLPAIFEDFQISLSNIRLAPNDFIFVRLAADEAGVDWGSDPVDFDFLVSTTPIGFNPGPGSTGPSSAINIPVLPHLGLSLLSILLLVVGAHFINRRK